MSIRLQDILKKLPADQQVRIAKEVSKIINISFKSLDIDSAYENLGRVTTQIRLIDQFNINVEGIFGNRFYRIVEIESLKENCINMFATLNKMIDLKLKGELNDKEAHSK